MKTNEEIKAEIARYVTESDSVPMPMINFWESRNNHVTGWIDRQPNEYRKV